MLHDRKIGDGGWDVVVTIPDQAEGTEVFRPEMGEQLDLQK